MAFTIEQIDDSQGEYTSSSTQFERNYLVRSDETTEEVNALDAIDQYILHKGLKRIGNALCKSIRAEVVEGSENRVWKCRVTWEKTAKTSGNNNSDFPKQDLGILTETFQITEEKRVARYGSTTTYTRSGYVASSYGSALLGELGQGIEETVPAFAFSIERRFPYSTVTDAVKQNWASLVGTVNNATFRGFPAGCVKFTGMNGKTSVEYDGTLVTVIIDGVECIRQKASAYYDVTFSFQAKPNETNVDASGITITTKPAWSTVWYEKEKVEDPTTGKLIDYPIAAHVTTTCSSQDFSVFLS